MKVTYYNQYNYTKYCIKYTYDKNAIDNYNYNYNYDDVYVINVVLYSEDDMHLLPDLFSDFIYKCTACTSLYITIVHEIIYDPYQYMFSIMDNRMAALYRFKNLYILDGRDCEYINNEDNVIYTLNNNALIFMSDPYTRVMVQVSSITIIDYNDSILLHNLVSPAKRLSITYNETYGFDYRLLNNLNYCIMSLNLTICIDNNNCNKFLNNIKRPYKCKVTLL